MLLMPCRGSLHPAAPGPAGAGQAAFAAGTTGVSASACRSRSTGACVLPLLSVSARPLPPTQPLAPSQLAVLPTLQGLYAGLAPTILAGRAAMCAHEDAGSQCPHAARPCRRDLEPYTHPAPLSLLSRMGLRIMPTSAQLAAAGRRDLAAAVRRAGGFLEVAQALGLRSQRKPAGYWEDEANLGEPSCPALPPGPLPLLLPCCLRSVLLRDRSVWAAARVCRMRRWRCGAHLLQGALWGMLQPWHQALSVHAKYELALPVWLFAPNSCRSNPSPLIPPSVPPSKHSDEELTLFVAAHWTQFTDPESRQPYWYNQAGGQG